MTSTQAFVLSLFSMAFLATIARESALRSGVSISLAKPVALAVFLVSAATAATLAVKPTLGVSGVFLLSLVAVNAVTDVESGFCFDDVHLWATLGLALSRYDNYSEAFCGTVLGVIVLGTPWALTQKRGIGLGDVKFAAVIGLGLGVPGEVEALYAAFVAAGAAGAAMLMCGTANRKSEIAFAPFLGFGTLCALVSSSIS